jgi:signal transduction histidine kinase
VEIHPKQTYVEIHYAGLSFLNPELVKFKYRLEGFDENWIDAGTRRTAYFTHLPPGEYAFRVAAANREGIWNETGTIVKIKVIPSFWQTRWFLTLFIASAVAAGFLIYYFRVSALKRQHAAQEAFSRRLIESQEAERKRIASELHDGLGQSLVVIKNRALIGLNSPENHERMVSQVEEIAEAASAAIGEVRDIARNLHPHQLDHLGLKTALETMIRSVESSSKIEFSSDIDKTDGKISKEAEINLYRVVQESLSNIVKHSEAGEARVSLKINGQVLTLTIDDNGKGFEQGAEKRSGGLGLVGIGERAKILGARYEIRSAPEKGTNIFLQMNLLPQKNET